MENRLQIILNEISALIIEHSGSLASEQYNPRHDPDSSDDYILKQKKWIKELRDIRERIENVVTGIIP